MLVGSNNVGEFVYLRRHLVNVLGEYLHSECKNIMARDNSVNGGSKSSDIGCKSVDGRREFPQAFVGRSQPLVEFAGADVPFLRSVFSVGSQSLMAFDDSRQPLFKIHVVPLSCCPRYDAGALGMVAPETASIGSQPVQSISCLCARFYRTGVFLFTAA